ncbi:hypothetical protein ACH35V_26620 [Actinomadura sp. 1N219]|uniref:hypothetical protein n=1 Tax=Actinomadura sp. 1N219 TaxID=3375152 RepID=UPI00378D0B5C
MRRPPEGSSRSRRRRRRAALAVTAASVMAASGAAYVLHDGRGVADARPAADAQAPSPSVGTPTSRPAPKAAPDGGTDAAARESYSPRPRPTGAGDCVLGANLVPRCGVLWGDSPGIDPLHVLEAKLGRRFDLVHFWHGVDQTTVPSREAKRLAAQGRILHVNIASRAFAGSGSARWSDVAAGRWDAALTKQARGVAAFGEPIFLTFDHEPDTKEKARTRGTPADFARAWRRVHDIYERNGATNAVWAWVLTGYSGNFPRAAGFYPGNRYVDWIGWENYLGTLCDGRVWENRRFRTFEQTFKPFYDWLKKDGVKAGIDPRKPYMLNGMASVRFADPALSVRWYQQLPAALARYPQIKAVQLWQPPKGMVCPYRLLDRPAEVAALAKAGRAPYTTKFSLTG